MKGVTIGVAGVNTAWSCGRDKEKGSIWLGASWQLETVRSRLPNSYLTILLMHHPSNWFHPADDPVALHEIETQFDFCLHGHEHTDWITTLTNGHVNIAAGASYGGSDTNTNGYNYVRLDLEAGTGEVWLREYEPKGGGWVSGRLFSRADDHGMVQLDSLRFNTRPKSKPHGTGLSAATLEKMMRDNSTVATLLSAVLIDRAIADARSAVQSGNPGEALKYLEAATA